MEDVSQEEINADPFGGEGVFLAMPGTDSPGIIDALSGVFGMIIPAVTWPGHGAWADPRPTPMTAADLLARWEAALTG
jgi:hypothetical protein